MDLKTSLENHLKKTGLIIPGQSVLAAVSGGMDSMSLLHVLKSIADKWNLKLTAGHINHGLRNESDDDEEFVRSITRTWDIPCYVRRLHPEKEVMQNQENWAREMRYKALEGILGEIKGDVIVTAHHANDQAETVLFRIQNKSGLDGLRGIHPRKGNVVRPLLPFTKSEIRKYVRENDIPFVQDETNADVTFSRNFIRHQVLEPWIRQEADIIDTLNKIGDEARKLGESLDWIVQKLAGDIVEGMDHATVRIPLTETRELPELMVLRIIRYVGSVTDPWRKSRWEDLKSFLRASSTGDVCFVSPKWRLLRDRNHWVMSSRKPLQLNLVVQPELDIPAGDHFFRWSWTESRDYESSETFKEKVDGEIMRHSPVILRTWETGDKFRPLGMKGHRKVSDFLTDLKLNRFEKEQQLVLETGDGIIWVCGRRISETARITDDSGQAAEISLTPMALS